MGNDIGAARQQEFHVINVCEAADQVSFGVTAIIN